MILSKRTKALICCLTRTADIPESLAHQIRLCAQRDRFDYGQATVVINALRSLQKGKK